MRLDVGCGASPTGDVNCDLMLHDSDQKWDQIPPHGSVFVKADVRFLPFKSSSFDVVFCSHLLEHLDDPWAGLSELVRVSRKKIVVILPFALFSVFDVLAHGRNFGDHVRWLRKNHKHFFLMNPLETGCFQLRFINLVDAVLYRKKSFHGLLRIPIPFETKTELWK